MRFVRKIVKDGDTRIVQKFALFPITIGLETRWLERVDIEQECDWGTQDDFVINPWYNKRFVDRGEK